MINSQLVKCLRVVGVVIIISSVLATVMTVITGQFKFHLNVVPSLDDWQSTSKYSTFSPLATSGTTFTMNKKRRIYNDANRVLEKKHKPFNFESRLSVNCRSENWIVLTTIFNVTNAILDFANFANDEWCTVIIGDKKGVERHEYEQQLHGASRDQHHSITYLDVSAQSRIFSDFEFHLHVPYNSFARKNLGYLYAIMNGARFIYDTDDDNKLVAPYATSGIPVIQYIDTMYFPKEFVGERLQQRDDIQTLNIFQLYTENEDDAIWPRGYDLEVLAESFEWRPPTQMRKIDETSQTHEYIIQQWLSNNEPDFDAIGRLTGHNRALKSSPGYFFSSTVDKQSMIEIPHSIYVPFNAQMTLWTELSFLLMYLPMSVHGRVSDIWRSYIAQSILQLLHAHFGTEYYLLYCPVLVEQIRNDHRNIADFESEIPLYLQTHELIRFLGRFARNYKVGNNMMDIGQYLLDLYVELYEYGVVEKTDVVAITAWIQHINGILKYRNTSGQINNTRQITLVKD